LGRIKYIFLTQSYKIDKGESKDMDAMKSKISVTVDKQIVDWIDRQVETQRFRNRSHAVEVALMRYIETEKKK
jgi:hypothetical protein